MQGVDVPGGVYAHIAGVDIVRAGAGDYYVLQDNLRVPSGVSYMLEDRRMMMRLFPELFARYAVAPVEHYPDLLLYTLRTVAPQGVNDLLLWCSPLAPITAPISNIHSWPSRWAWNWWKGPDSFVQDDSVDMRTTQGPKRVDATDRRVDDDFLDPLAFRPDSMLGVPGLLSVYRAGRVTLANAIGTGVADDKSIYPYVPAMIRFYLGEEPILHNVPTYMLRNKEDSEYTLAHLPELVVKETHGSGGYGMLVGPALTTAQIEDFRQRIIADPEKYIAQPTLALSACPTFVERRGHRAAPHRSAAVRAFGKRDQHGAGGRAGSRCATVLWW